MKNFIHVSRHSFFLFTFLLPLHFLFAQQIAITLDDAPMGNGPLFTGEERSQRILDHLKNHEIKEVAFFVITGSIDLQNTARLKAYTDAGHLLGNHTHTHSWIHRIGVNQYIGEIIHANSILRNYDKYQPWFRYPFLDEGRKVSTRDSIRMALKETGLINAYITVDNYDWYLNSLLQKALEKNQKVDYAKLKQVYLDHLINSIEFYNDIAINALGRSPSHVLLLHENDLAALYLGDLLLQLKDRGWKIISPKEAYQDDIALQVPDVLMNGQGRVAAIAREQGSAAKDLVQESEDEKFLDELIERLNVFK